MKTIRNCTLSVRLDPQFPVVVFSKITFLVSIKDLIFITGYVISLSSKQEQKKYSKNKKYNTLFECRF